MDLRLALAFATMRDSRQAAARWNPAGETTTRRGRYVLPVLRPLLSPVDVDPRYAAAAWTDRPTPVATVGGLRAAVLAASRLRAQHAPENDVYAVPDQGSSDGAVSSGARGVLLAPQFGGRLALRDLELFGSGTFDDERAMLLLSGLLCVDFTGTGERATDVDDVAVDAGVAMLSLFALPGPISVTTEAGVRRSVLRANRSWPSWLHAGRTGDVLADAAQRLRLAGFRHVVTPHSTAHPAALAAALLLPPQSAQPPQPAEPEPENHEDDDKPPFDERLVSPVRRLLARFSNTDWRSVGYASPHPTTGRTATEIAEEMSA